MSTVTIQPRLQPNQDATDNVDVAEAPITPTSHDTDPHGAQRVFDVVPLNITNKHRRIAVTTLLILTNLCKWVTYAITFQARRKKY